MGLNPHTFAGTIYGLVNPLEIKQRGSFDCDERQRALRVREAKADICCVVTLASIFYPCYPATRNFVGQKVIPNSSISYV